MIEQMMELYEVIALEVEVIEVLAIEEVLEIE